MNTAELAERIAAEHDLGKGQARKVVEAVLATIVQAAVSGEEVALGGFGRFKVADRPARQGRNPATGEAMEIAASRKLAFTPAKPVREALNAAPAVNGTKARPGTGSATQSARTPNIPGS